MNILNLEEEPDRVIISLPNCLRHVCNMISTVRSIDKTNGVSSDGGYLSNPFFADDVALIDNSTQTYGKYSEIFMTSHTNTHTHQSTRHISRFLGFSFFFFVYIEFFHMAF